MRVKVRKFILLVGGFLGVILSCELFSFSVLALHDLWRGVSVGETLRNRAAELKSPWRKVTFYGGFDPVLQVRHVPGTSYGNLSINSDGFIGNGHSDPLLNTFPEKPAGLYRIVCLGGSALAGAGAQKNSQTIPAYLESLLNEKNFNPNVRFQVLNFGSAGGYTGAELWKFFAQVTHYEPDLVICWDGFNDIWNAVFEPYRVGIKNGIINWSDYSYRYFEFMGGCADPTLRPPKLLTLSVILMDKVLRQLRRTQTCAESLYEQLPWYHHSRMIQQRYPYFENVLASNLDAFAATATVNRHPGFIGYLQPQAYAGKDLTPSEEARLDEWHRRYVSHDAPQFAKELYVKEILPAMESYALVYAALGKKYHSHRQIRWIDARNLFKEVQEDVYIDPIHYTDLGNQLIAQRMYDDVREMVMEKDDLRDVK